VSTGPEFCRTTANKDLSMSISSVTASPPVAPVTPPPPIEPNKLDTKAAQDREDARSNPPTPPAPLPPGQGTRIDQIA
jgi:hypothetical protein